MESQNAEILRLLKTHRQGITAIDAMSEANCWRLAARVHDLRSAGHEIETRMEDHSNGKHARYFLKRVAMQSKCPE